MAKDNKKSDGVKDPRIRLYSVTVCYIFQECFKEAGLIIGDEFEDKTWSGRLIDALKEKYPVNIAVSGPSYDQYIVDRFRLACIDINAGHPFINKGYSLANFEPLLAYGKTTNFKEINTAFRTNTPKFFIEPKKKLKLDIDAIARFMPVPGQEKDIDKQIIAPLPEAEALKPPNAKAGAQIVKVPAVYTIKRFSKFDVFTRITRDEGELWFYDNSRVEWHGDTDFTVADGVVTPQLFRMPNDNEALWVKIEMKGHGQPSYLYFAEQAAGENPLKLLAPQRIFKHFSNTI